MYSLASHAARSVLTGIAALLLGLGASAQDPVEKSLKLSSGETLQYVERLPSGSAPDAPLRLFICLPPGSGDRGMVTAARQHLGDLAWSADYLTVYPVARDGGFVGAAASEVIELLEHIIEQHDIDTDRVVLAGISNGGRALFDVARLAPQGFAALVAVPGTAETSADLQGLAGKPVWMRVGAVDSDGWRDGSRATAERLRMAGCSVDFEQLEGQGHVLALAEQGLTEWLDLALAPTPRRIQFPAPDGLPIEADLYGADDRSRPMIVLCHQAGSSRGEYAPIAPRLVQAGFACLAIDQRSGEGMNDVPNETAARAQAASRGQEYVDARQDIEAALDWVRDAGFKGKLVLWGSSYSASLALTIAPDRKDLAAVLSFAPGEYFGGDHPVGRAAARIACPVLVVAPEGERASAEPLVDVIQSEREFLIDGGIVHGSKTLFRGTSSAMVWDRVLRFLDAHTRE
ncbi:MAG: dienelactone hydrolase [Chlamydiales bacterium]|jgi:dienelactone hydrolase